MDTEHQVHATHHVVVGFKGNMPGNYTDVEVLHENGPVTCGMPDSCLLEFLLDNGHHGRLPQPGEYVAHAEEVIITSEEDGDYVVFTIKWVDILDH